MGKGSANVTFSSAREATAAIKQLDHTIMEGNSRFIDVIPGGDRAVEAKRFKGSGKEAQGGKGVETWGGKGGVWTFIPTSGGKGGKYGDHSDEDPAGSGRVFVRGFDFETSNEQLEDYMSQTGAIHAVHFVNKGNAVVVYKRKGSAAQAVSSLDNTTIPGNARYINVDPRY